MLSLFVEDTLAVFVIMTVVIGGGAAYLAGRNLASRWRPWWMPAAYMVLLGFALRFFHYALFNGNLFSLPLFHHRHGGPYCSHLAWATGSSDG